MTLLQVHQAMRHVQSGMRVFIGSGAAVPTDLLAGLCEVGPSLTDVRLYSILTLGDAPTAAPELAGHLRHQAFFVGDNVRAAVHEGRADFIPVCLSDVASLLRGPLPIDVALVSVSMPDAHGFCSLGVSVDIVKPAVDSARIVIAEMNPQMPRTHGDAFVHVSRLHMVSVDHPLPTLEDRHPPDDVARAIGRHVAGLVEDGSTLQLGIGSIPNAVLECLQHHKDLGVHTEMFSDGVASLVDAGVINNRRKTLHRGKIVASFVMGSDDLYTFVDDNPMVEMHPSHYVNDAFIIAQNERMVSINSALSIDLSGQACADSVGYDVYSGTGGQADFVRGANRSKGGKSILALPSTAKGGVVSRICGDLLRGSGVTTSRSDIHFVVTEYGVAELKGKNLRERVKALVSVAHPKFRDGLLASAREQRWI